MSDFFDHMASLQRAVSRTAQTLNVPYGDPFNEEGVIADTRDPKQEGRVKVLFPKDQIETDWIYVAGSATGTLSSQYIGARCTVVKIGGESSTGIVTAIYSSTSGSPALGNPMQIPVISDQLATANTGTEGDPGLKCNEGNKGRAYIVSNEMGQDLVICLRRNSIQRDGGDKPVWAWKSLTHSEWVEKGFDPGAAKDNLVRPLYQSNPGIPKCTKDLAGEVHEFSEDRKFRSFQIRCSRDENGNYIWIPASATPTFFRTTLPTCTESLHGMNAVIDTGKDSEFVVCSRYAGKMLWTKQGKREPIQFYNKDLPVAKIDWLRGMKPIPTLNATPADKSIARGFEDLVAMEFLATIPPTGTDPFLRSLLDAANALPGTFDSAQTWSNVAKALILNKGKVSVDSLVTQLATAFETGGDISPGTSQVLSSLGGIADILVTGVQSNSTADALQTIGQKAIGEALASFSPAAAATFYGYTIGGYVGAIDSAVAVGLDILPPTLRGIMSPIASIGELALKGQPIEISNIVDAALNGGLVDAVSSILTGKADFSSFNFDNILSTVTGGGFGPVSQILGDFSSLTDLAKIGTSGLPLTASTVLSTLNLGVTFAKFFGVGGVGIDIASKVLSSNSIAGLIGSITGLFGSKKAGCPCDPSCRKTEHGKDSDGVNLLEKCGNVTQGRGSHNPTNDPTKTNQNPVAKAIGAIPTGVGEVLQAALPVDLTGFLTLPKLKNLSETVFNARNADFPELMAELSYSFEAVELALKHADNNISKIEGVNRDLIDTAHNMLTSLLKTGGGTKKSPGIVNELITAVQQNSKAIRDLYAFTKTLDKKKEGPKGIIKATPAIVSSISSIKSLLALNSLGKKEANRILNRGIRKADKAWRALGPGLDKLSLSDVILGSMSTEVPVNFEDSDLVTKFDSNRILNYSLGSQVNNVDPQTDPLTPRLFGDQLNDPEITTLFDEVNKANEGDPQC